MPERSLKRVSSTQVSQLLLVLSQLSDPNGPVSLFFPLSVIASKNDELVTPAPTTSFVEESGVNNVLIQDICEKGEFYYGGRLSHSSDAPFHLYLDLQTSSVTWEKPTTSMSRTSSSTLFKINLTESSIASTIPLSHFAEKTEQSLLPSATTSEVLG